MDRRHRQSTYAHVTAGPKDYAAMLPPRLPRADRGRIYELGSGWGGLSRALADVGRISRLLALSYRRYHYL